MNNKELCIKLIKDDFNYKKELFKQQYGREPSTSETTNIINEICKELIKIDGVNIKYDLFLKDVEKAGSDYQVGIKKLVDKHKLVLEEIEREQNKLLKKYEFKLNELNDEIIEDIMKL